MEQTPDPLDAGNRQWLDLDSSSGSIPDSGPISSQEETDQIPVMLEGAWSDSSTGVTIEQSNNRVARLALQDSVDDREREIKVQAPLEDDARDIHIAHDGSLALPAEEDSPDEILDEETVERKGSRARFIAAGVALGLLAGLGLSMGHSPLRLFTHGLMYPPPKLSEVASARLAPELLSASVIGLEGGYLFAHARDRGAKPKLSSIPLFLDVPGSLFLAELPSSAESPLPLNVLPEIQGPSVAWLENGNRAAWHSSPSPLPGKTREPASGSVPLVAAASGNSELWPARIQDWNSDLPDRFALVRSAAEGDLLQIIDPSSDPEQAAVTLTLSGRASASPLSFFRNQKAFVAIVTDAGMQIVKVDRSEAPGVVSEFKWNDPAGTGDGDLAACGLDAKDGWVAIIGTRVKYLALDESDQLRQQAVEGLPSDIEGPLRVVVQSTPKSKQLRLLVFSPQRMLYSNLTVDPKARNKLLPFTELERAIGADDKFISEPLAVDANDDGWSDVIIADSSENFWMVDGFGPKVKHLSGGGNSNASDEPLRGVLWHVTSTKNKTCVAHALLLRNTASLSVMDLPLPSYLSEADIAGAN